jgi:hypothetical protein
MLSSSPRLIRGTVESPPAKAMASSTRRERTLRVNAVLPVNLASCAGFRRQGPGSRRSAAAAGAPPAAAGVAPPPRGTAGAREVATGRGVTMAGTKAMRAGLLVTEGSQCRLF